HHPDLVILDIDMPVMDGFTACERIRAIDEGRDLPIVMVTGDEDSRCIERAYEVGATDFVSKPVNWSLLGHRVRYILRSARVRTALAEREAENRAMLQAIPDRVLSLTREGGIVALKTQDAGVSQEASLRLPRTLKELLPADVVPTAERAIKSALSDQSEVGFEYSEPPESEGSVPRSYEMRMVPQSDNVVLAILREVTARKQSEARIKELAFFDSLCGLPNRHHFMEMTQAMIRRADPATDRYALCTINLDRFKRINDTLGHAAGDALLVSVAGLLGSVANEIRDQGMCSEVARLGADQFALLAGWSAGEEGIDVPAKLMSAFEHSIECAGHEVVLSASIGTAQFPAESLDAAELLLKAERELFAAKRRGRNQVSGLTGTPHGSSGDQILLESELKRAIEQNELRLYFQPKVHLHSGRIVGAEALVRWQHPSRGLISPGHFIPLAEESGLISQIDRWVIDRAASHLSAWKQAGLPVVPLSVNLSGRGFCFAQPEAVIKAALDKHAVDPALMEIEITETVMMDDPIAAAATLNRLKSMGLRLAMDDFGTGYSSLSYLKNYPLDVLKIDQTFVKNLHNSARDQALCRSIISMTRGLGMECVAEGVEVESQRQFLVAEGCDVAQGFALAIPADEKAYIAGLMRNRELAPRLAVLR
ncbi:MAG: EAL domain-containing protein, partial [Pseudomonadota bacterium]